MTKSAYGFRACSARRTLQSTDSITSDSPHVLRLDDVYEGDLIALFLGAKLPFVAREMGSDVRILVGCYAHSIIDGKAMQGAAEWQESLRDIVLK
jgi:hypothetical protein